MAGIWNDVSNTEYPRPYSLQPDGTWEHSGDTALLYCFLSARRSVAERKPIENGGRTAPDNE